MENLDDFKLENYLAVREFSSRYLLGSSDAESRSMAEILAMADEECLNIWNNMQLSYTETRGHPLLRKEISCLYADSIKPKNVMTFTGAEEGIYATCHALLGSQDHVIVVTPCYQSLESVPASICDVTAIALAYEKNWELDISAIKQAIRPNTKLLVINYPHNPTGAIISKQQQSELIELARANDMWILSDEVYYYMELDPADRLPLIANVYQKGLSLGVMSKAFGLAGLRLGWIACQDTDALLRIDNMKHYLSICNSAPSEVLALMALRNKEEILQRNLEIMRSNIVLLDDFFNNHQDHFEWVRPKGGCIGFPKIKLDISSFDYCEQLLYEKGVVTLPGDIFNSSDNHFRIGFGRRNMPEALKEMEDFIYSITDKK